MVATCRPVWVQVLNQTGCSRERRSGTAVSEAQGYTAHWDLRSPPTSSEPGTPACPLGPRGRSWRKPANHLAGRCGKHLHGMHCSSLQRLCRVYLKEMYKCASWCELTPIRFDFLNHLFSFFCIFYDTKVETEVEWDRWCTTCKKSSVFFSGVHGKVKLLSL